MFPAGATVKNTGTVNVDNDQRRDTVSQEYSIGFERQLASDLSINADYIHVSGRDIADHAEPESRRAREHQPHRHDRARQRGFRWRR